MMDATENFNKAAKLVREGRYQEAREVELLKSDRNVIEDRIAAKSANSGANDLPLTGPVQNPLDPGR